MSYFPNTRLEILTIVEGLPTWTNIGGDVVSPFKVTLGFSDGDQLSRLAPGSDIRFDLFNPTGTYDPSTSFFKSQKIRLIVQYGSLTKVKFFGYIDHIGLDPGTWGPRQAHVIAVDWLTLAARTPIRALEGLTDTTIDLAVAALLTQMQIQPEETDFEIGDITLPSVFDQVTVNSTVYSELQNLVMGEWGYIYMRDGGQTLKVENSLSRTGDGSDYRTIPYYHPDGVEEPFLLPDSSNFLLPDGTNFLLPGEPTSDSFDSNFGQEYTDIKINHGDNLKNKISASAVPVVVGGSTLVLYPFSIATGSKALFVPPNFTEQPYILQGQYKDPTAGGAQISGDNVIPPAVTTDWLFNSKADGTGTDLSANLTINFTDGRSGFKASIINAGGGGYLTKFNVRGVPVYRYSPVETVFQDQRSIWDYGDYSLQFTRQYGANSNDIQPFMFRLLMRDRKPRTIFSNPKFNAWDTSDHLAGFLALDIGDQIRLESTKPAEDALFYIQGYKFTILPGSELTTVDYVTTETLAASIAGVTEIAIEQDALNQGVNFRTLPVVSNLTFKSITARIYLVDPLASLNSVFNLGGSFTFFSPTVSGSRRISIEKVYSGTNGQWQSGGTVVPTNTWCDIAATLDSSSVSNVPIFYLDGIALSLTTVLTPVGTPIDEVGSPLTIGGFLTSYLSYTGAFCGKLENVAVYNRILTAAEIATIHNSGTRLPFASYPQSGLKFFFGGVDTETYALRLDDNLETLDTVYDLVNGFTGQPINGPILRAVG